MLFSNVNKIDSGKIRAQRAIPWNPNVDFCFKRPKTYKFYASFLQEFDVGISSYFACALLLTDVRDLVYCREMQFMDSLSILWFSILANHLWISSSLTYWWIILFSGQIYCQGRVEDIVCELALWSFISMVWVDFIF